MMSARLYDLLAAATEERPDLWIDTLGARRTTLEALWQEACCVAGGMQADGVKPGSQVLLLTWNHSDFLAGFWGALFAGCTPVPLAGPRSMDPRELGRVQRVMSRLDGPVVVDRGVRFPGLAVSDIGAWLEAPPVSGPSGRDAPALIQFSSGSTGAPKGAVLSHDNVLASVHQMVTRLPGDADDIKVSWMPHYHDMGLVGCHLLPLGKRMCQVRMDALAAVRDPRQWMEVTAKYRGTVLSTTNFALHRLTGVLERYQGALPWDLSCVRMIFNGAEPVSADVLRRFCEASGLPPSVHFPVYGMSEATVAIVQPATGGIRTRMVEGRELVVLGEPLDGMEIRVVGDDGAVLEDGQLGELQFRGPNVCEGYLADPEATAAALDDGWMRSGDIVHVVDRQVVVTGRGKDVIILNGVNHHAHDLERAAQQVPGVRGGGAVALHDDRDEVESLVMVVQVAKDQDTAPVLWAVARAVQGVCGQTPRCLPIDSIPRTTSGKKQRSLLRRRLQKGQLDSLVGNTLGVVQGIWSDVLEQDLTAEQLDASFQALGGTSIQAMQILVDLEARLGLMPDHRLLLEGHTVRRMAQTIEQTMRSTTSAHARATADAVAIVSAACRLPGADTVEQFWDNVAAETCFLGAPPPSRGLDVTSPAAYIGDVARFDAARWDISPAEAAAMDPQQRLLLDVSAEALERAGGIEDRRVGVFVGAGQMAYAEHVLAHQADGLPPGTLAGNLLNMLAARVSHHMDFLGPAMTIDTACSASLVALHQAARSIRDGECQAAVVAGVNLNLTRSVFSLFGGAGALSPTGRCRPFAAGADGTLLGEGVVAMVVMPLAAAKAQGRPILAVVRGSAINNDGTSLGVMAPNPAGQEAVIRQALAAADVAPEAVGFVEAHGTGTRIGDQVERSILARCYGEEVTVGAVKRFVGHLLGAAGITGLLRVVGALRRPETGATLGAVSSFGFGGTNAHLIIEAGPSDSPPMRSVVPVPETRFWLGPCPVPHEATPVKVLPAPPAVTSRWAHVVQRDPAGGLSWRPCPTGPTPLKQGGRYLITGATGGLGRILSLYLARHYAASLLLVSRGQGARASALAQDVSAEGGEARIFAVDLTDGAAVASLVDSVQAVDGVFHLAGVSGAEAGAVKRDGLLALEGISAGFWCYYSSISAVLPGLDKGIEAYAEANRWLDRHAVERSASGVRAVSIAWAPWRGMGLAADVAGDLSSRGLTAIDGAEGMAALEHALGSGAPHVVVLDRGVSGEEAARHDMDHDTLMQAVRVRIAEAADLPVSRVQPDLTLTELGIDSLAAMDLVQELERLVGYGLPTTLLFEHTTLAGIVGAIGAGVSREGDAAQQPSSGTLPGEPILPSQQTFVVQQDFFPDLAGNVLLAVDVSAEDGAPLDREVLAQAWSALLVRHPALTSVIEKHGDVYCQLEGVCTPAVEWREAVHDAEISNERFDLAHGPLARCVTDGRRLVLHGHHSIVDAWSQKNALEDLLQAYEDIRSSGSPRWTPIRSTWVSAMRAIRAAASDDVSWWQTRFREGVPPVHLPWRQPATVPSHGGCDAHSLVLDRSATSRFRAAARAWGVTPPAVALAAYMLTLWDHSGQPTVTVRVAHGRRELRLPDATRLVGSFADALPVQHVCHPGSRLEDVARALQASLTETQAHADASSMALTALADHGTAGPVGITPVGFSFPLLPAPSKIGSLSLSGLHGMAGAGFTRLALIAWIFDGRLHTSWCYARSHLHADDVAGLAEHFVRRLTADVVREDAPLHHRVLRRCRMHPERVAVQGVTYGMLDRRSGALAKSLRPLGESRVGVLGVASADAVVSLLGVMRAGAAYVPLDPSWPQARLSQIIEHAELSHVVTTAELASVLDGIEVSVHVLDPEAEADDGPEEVSKLAYVMYTSGSTGTPKGVMVPHRSVCTFLDWVQRVFGVTEDDRFVATASLGYGGSIRQIFAPLLSGATIHPVAKAMARDPDSLVSWMASERITIWNSVPSMWVHLMDAADRSSLESPFASVRWVLVGGEAVPADLVRRWRARHGGRVVNLYGSTETIVNATFFEVVQSPARDALYTPIGWARGGVHVHLLDIDDGVGEIGVGGAIASGYLHSAEETAAAFFDHPQWGRLYRTGDLARRQPDGSLLFLGRKDTQVQVRGNRVELSEIEHTLINHPTVDHAMVTYRELTLEAWVQPRSGSAVDGLRAWVAARLPDYMVPHRFHVVDEIPRNPAGKADRLAVRAAAVVPVRHEGDLLGRVAAAWQQVLGLDRLPHADDDFFALGGDSIRALLVLDHIRPHIDAVLRPMTLYQHTKLGSLVRALAELAPASPPARRHEPKVPDDDTPYALSMVQRSFWTTHHRSTGRQPVWSARVRLRGELDRRALVAAMDSLVSQHDQLRTVFTATRDGPVQRTVSVGSFPLQYDDLTALPAERIDRALANRWDEEGYVGFELDTWPLFRVRVCKVADREHELMLSAHHIISDAWSFWLMASALCALHDGDERRLSATPNIRFRDVVASETMVDDPWWRTALHGLGALPAADTRRGVSSRVVVPKATWSALKHLARERAVTPYALVLTAVARALQEVLSVDDVVVSTAISGRDSTAGDVSEVVGAFARAIPVRLRETGIAAVAETLRETMAHTEASALSMAAGVPRDAWGRLARFFLSWLEPATLVSSGTQLTLDWEDATFRFASESTETELMIGAVADAQLTLHLDGSGLVDKVAPALERALLSMVEPSSALVVYVPEGFPVPVREPTLIETVRLPGGVSEVVLLPMRAADLRDSAALDSAVREAVRATRAGTVALAGMLPALTGLGTRALAAEGQQVTTGHTVTVVAMVLAVERALESLGSAWTDAHVGMLGYGSIGTAVLALAEARLGAPRSITICDPGRADGHADLSGCDLILGATSGGATLDVDALAPGTVVVDDSFPRGFDDAAAMRRMTSDGDVLLVGGGMVDVGTLVRQSPFAEAPAVRALYPHRWLPGCHAEAVLLSLEPSIGPTSGVVTSARAARVLEKMEARGWTAAPLHLGTWDVPESLIASVRRAREALP